MNYDLPQPQPGELWLFFDAQTSEQGDSIDLIVDVTEQFVYIRIGIDGSLFIPDITTFMNFVADGIYRRLT